MRISASERKMTQLDKDQPSWLVLVLNWSTTTISGGRGSSVRGNHRIVLQR